MSIQFQPMTLRDKAVSAAASGSAASGMMALWLLGWMVIGALSTYGTYRYWRNVERRFEAPPADGVAVLIPIKGVPGQSAALRDFIDNCLAQRGAEFRLIVSVEAHADPAAPIIAEFASTRSNVTLVIAGRATSRGQKVHNLLAALAALGPQDKYIVFADADMALPPHWLGQLLRPLLLGRADIASGYRWILPTDDQLASRCCALIDWGIATAARSRRWNLCWGGSTAITRRALDRIDVTRIWAHSALDDLVLGRAARRAGFQVHAPHHVLVPTPVRHSLRSLFAFGRRQYLFVRVHAPWHWRCAGITLMVPTIAGIMSILGLAEGQVSSIICLAVAGTLQQVRAGLRVRIARRVLPPGEAIQAAALVRRDRLKLPAVHIVHVAIWLSSAFGRTMIWGGRRYRLTGFGRVEVLDDPVHQRSAFSHRIGRLATRRRNWRRRFW